MRIEVRGPGLWRGVAGWAALVAWLGLPLRATAQESPRVRLGAGVVANLLVGEARDFLDGGIGGILTATYRLDRGDHVRLRVDAGLASLADDSGGRTGARAENSLVSLLGGVQLTGRLGPVRPYASPLLGLLAVSWRIEPADPVVGGSDFDGGFAWGGLAGLGIAAGGGDHPVVLAVEGRLMHTDHHAFASVSPTGGPGPGLLRTDFGVLSVRLLVTIGL
jgi:hypothetical protein